MEWLNENAGVVVLVFGLVLIVMLGIVLWLVFTLRSRIAVQRLKFVGLYSADAETRVNFASLTIGNRSVNEVALKELGIQNGRVSFDLTALYKRKAGLDEKARIVIDQRHSLSFSMTADELRSVLVDGKNGKELHTLKLYALDLTGNLYRGNIAPVKKLLAVLLAEERSGKKLLPAPAAQLSQEAPAAQAEEAAASEEPVSAAPAEDGAASEQPAERDEARM